MQQQRVTDAASTHTPEERAEGQSSVKKHHHTHRLKRRYEVLETLGTGTYGKVKRAVARQCGKTVSDIVLSFEFTCH